MHDIVAVEVRRDVVILHVLLTHELSVQPEILLLDTLYFALAGLDEGVLDRATDGQH